MLLLPASMRLQCCEIKRPPNYPINVEQLLVLHFVIFCNRVNYKHGLLWNTVPPRAFMKDIILFMMQVSLWRP